MIYWRTTNAMDHHQNIALNHLQGPMVLRAKNFKMV